MVTDAINNNKVSIPETKTHSDVPKENESNNSAPNETPRDTNDICDRNPCMIHPHCIHRENCDRSMCLLFFQPGVTWDDLKDAVREWLKIDTLRTLGRSNYGREGVRPTDIERFLKANHRLFKTTIAYTVLAFAVTEAVLEVAAE
jgi:arginine/lysine/ornithine decarboxylase